MGTLFYVSIGFLLLYIFLVMKPGLLGEGYRMFAGISYFLFCITFIIFIYLYKSSILLALLTIPLLFVFMYVIQMILGSIKYYMRE